MTARPVTLFCLARNGRHGKRWLNTSTIARTKADVRRIYLAFYTEEHRPTVIAELKSGVLEIVPVIITEITQ